MLSRARLASALILLVLVATGLGCSPSGAPAASPVASTVPPRSTALPAATRMPTLAPVPSPRDIVEAGVASLVAAGSYRFEMDMIVFSKPPYAPYKLLLATEGDFEAPDRMRVTVSVTSTGHATQIDAVFIGEVGYVRNTETGQWEISQEPISPFFPDQFARLEPARLRNLEIAGEETLGGESVFHITGVVASEELLSAYAGMTGILNVDYWIGVGDGLLRGGALRGTLAPVDAEGGTIEVEASFVISDIGQTLSIEEPEVAASPRACTGAAEGFLDYFNEAAGVSLCYPRDWIVDDQIETFGVLAVGPGSAGEQAPVALLLVYPHETLMMAGEPTTDTGSLVPVGISFLSRVLDDISNVGDVVSQSDRRGHVSTAEVVGTLGGDPVSGAVTAIRNDGAVAVVLSFQRDERAHGAVTAAIADSVHVGFPRLAAEAEPSPLGLGEIGGGIWTPRVYQYYRFSAPVDTPVLIVCHLTAAGSGESTPVVRLYGPDRRLAALFRCGSAGSWGIAPHPDGGWIHSRPFGLLAPDVLRFVVEEPGSYIASVGGGAHEPVERPYFLEILDLRHDGPAISAVYQGVLDASPVHEYPVEGVAGRPVIALVRPTGHGAGEANLWLQIVGPAGASVALAGDLFTTGQPTTLYWVPAEDGRVTLRVREAMGRPAEYELTLLEIVRPDEPDQVGRDAAYLATCTEHDVEIEVRENGDLAVQERQTLEFGRDQGRVEYRTLTLSHGDGLRDVEVWEGDRQYIESEGGEEGTYKVLTVGLRATINWYYSASANSQRTFTVRYVVPEGVQGDPVGVHRLAWPAISSEGGYATHRAHVVVRLPAEVQIHEMIAYGAQGEATARSLSPLELVTSEVDFTVVHGVEVGQSLWIVIEYSPEWVTGETAQTVEGQRGLSGEVTLLGAGAG